MEPPLISPLIRIFLECSESEKKSLWGLRYINHVPSCFRLYHHCLKSNKSGFRQAQCHLPFQVGVLGLHFYIYRRDVHHCKLLSPVYPCCMYTLTPPTPSLYPHATFPSFLVERPRYLLASGVLPLLEMCLGQAASGPRGRGRPSHLLPLTHRGLTTH